MTVRSDELRLEIQAMEELEEVARKRLAPDDGIDALHCDTLATWISERRGVLAEETSTLAELFAEGQRVPELDDDDFGELCEIVEEEATRRGWTCDIYRPPAGAREVVVHLNVSVPADDKRNAGEIAEAITGALEVGSDDDSVRGLTIVAPLAEEV